MATVVRSQTPLQDPYGAISQPANPIFSGQGYGSRSASRPNSFIASNSGYNFASGAVTEPSVSHNGRFHEEFDVASQRGSVAFEGPSSAAVQRSASQMSNSRSATPTRSGTLKKKSSLSKRGSDKEKYSVDGAEDHNSAFYIPVPTNGNPTEVLADRFQAWRKVLKDLIVFFKELQKSYETRSKLFMSASTVINNTALPPTFLKSGGLADATDILRNFHKQAYQEASKAAEVENELVAQLMGLRNDLQKKTKEIRSLSGDFRNSIDKEVDATRKSVRHLHEALGLVDTDSAATAGKGDPFIIRLGVDKQIEKQIEEENYLHRAFLNLENSGRELESIVVSEIQKAYKTYANILTREADEAYDAAEKLRAGPISMPHDHEWNSFIAETDELVDPRVPLRDVENISYPGKDHPAAAEVRSGMLERKSKYLKSYTPGWYVLSPTHLHEFKSADRVAWQTPVMSLYLPEQKLGSHSQPDSSSHKFMLKGRQTGTMHRGHSWVFRAESHETMKAWYEDVESLISKTGEARNAFVRKHVRTVSGASFGRTSTSSDRVMDEDEADRTPYSAGSVVLNQDARHLNRAPLSPSSGESSGERDLLAAVGSLPDAKSPLQGTRRSISERDMDIDQVQPSSQAGEITRQPFERHDSYYGGWMNTADHQKQVQAQQIYDNTQDTAGFERGNMAPNLIAGLRATNSRESSLSRQRNRGESTSTAPTTTNVTDHTLNTVPTSIDERPESISHGPDEPMTDSWNKGQGPPSVRTASSTTAVPINTPSPGIPHSNEGMKRPPAATKNSVSTLDLKIPGHYPPANVPA
ncbi:PH domain protein [Aspergillus nomiae NRRL 13137]|uniref:PH domain protein n=1 Tax=Aspergillus nomiae NRRL (strain ATCC 15546 / NRRL 13137 / CBS 260.88 / M93) TaxID=1509407 RepID=A0A0L1IPN8_ASPN3|nr:PH domain protein [Aspergillus nomiae NRRL 13137]KNG81434.1 PH domain protein [Aspergillus nomiae NRRL 13137]